MEPWPLLARSRKHAQPDSGALLDEFLEYVSSKGTTLYPAQEEAILELYSGKNLILKTPTGSGKSLVATALHFDSLARGRRSVYTCPIKALVNEKFLALCQDFGPEQVGMITGDASVNAGAPILCCTAEILSNLALRVGEHGEGPDQVDDVIMDEFHYYSDRERGVAWQIPILTMSRTRFLLMSATLGETDFFKTALTDLNGRETVTVESTTRPVPLEYEYRETPLHETVSALITRGRYPVYMVCFTQKGAAEEAQNLLSVDFSTKEEKKKIAENLEGFKFTSPYGKELSRFLKHGVGIHHAGLLPKYRVLIERLAQKGLLKVICGTDTLGVGVNVPIRTVLLTKLCKYDGEKTALLSVRDFQQISGRAGRKGFDDLGTVVAQAPEHVIENLRQEEKAAGDPKKIKKLVKRKPPEKGFVAWNKETFEKLYKGQPESLVSRFSVNHSMILNVLSRTHEDGCKALLGIIRACHDSDHSKKHHRKRAFQLFRSLIDRKIIEIIPYNARTSPAKVRVHASLQEDFSLHHALSLYLLDAIQALSPESPDYAFDTLTLVESILENPDAILRKQLDRIKGEKIMELKAQGMDYDQRMEELEKLEYPKPCREFIYETFNAFAEAHPWIGLDNIRPKSIAREMFETFQSFHEYIRDNDLLRMEGVLLRYLSDVLKVLVQTVPNSAKDERLLEITDYFSQALRTIDSSLLDEWQRLRDPSWVAPPDLGAEAAANEAQRAMEFGVALRNEIFRFVRELARGDFEGAAALVEGEWNAEKLEQLTRPVFESGGRIRTDTPARAPKHLKIEPADWRTLMKRGVLEQVQATQLLVDAEGEAHWQVIFDLNLIRSRELGRPVLKLISMGEAN